MYIIAVLLPSKTVLYMQPHVPPPVNIIGTWPQKALDDLIDWQNACVSLVTFEHVTLLFKNYLLYVQFGTVLSRKNLLLATELGDRAAQGRVFGNLGNTYYLLGDFKQAVNYHRQVVSVVICAFVCVCVLLLGIGHLWWCVCLIFGSLTMGRHEGTTPNSFPAVHGSCHNLRKSSDVGQMNILVNGNLRETL